MSVFSTTGGSPTTYNDTTFLYYENPNNTVSVLLRGSFNGQGAYKLGVDQRWVDITRQGSQSMPDSSVTVNSSYYVKNPTILSPPFTSAANWSGFSVGALIFSPAPNAAASNNGPPASDGFVIAYYASPDKFDFGDCMHCALFNPNSLPVS